MKNKSIDWVGVVLAILVILILLAGTLFFIHLNHKEESRENSNVTSNQNSSQNELSENLNIKINPHYKEHTFKIHS